eukprot:jgi/Mesvir1/13244/Mv18977-RA.1
MYDAALVAIPMSASMVCLAGTAAAGSVAGLLGVTSWHETHQLLRLAVRPAAGHRLSERGNGNSSGGLFVVHVRVLRSRARLDVSSQPAMRAPTMQFGGL